MPIGQDVTHEPATRQERLSAWLRQQEITLTALIDLAGLNICVARLSVIFGQETMPVRHHRRLVAIGVPAELLPRPMDLKPGRKRKPKPLTHDAAMAAFRGL